MATANTTFTQEQIDNLSGVAKKYGGFDNQNFQTAVNTKYGAGSYDSLKSNLSAINEAQKAKAQPAPVISAQVTPIGQQTTEGAPQQPQHQAETNLNTPISSVPAPQAITPPPAVEKTTTITPEGQTVVKKETPTTDFNVGVGREQEILKNLNEGANTNPDLFQNQETFRTAYGYATADDTKKKILDDFFQSKNTQINNPDALFQQIATNQPIYNPQIKTSPAYQKALSRFNDMNINAGLTTNELSDKIRDGSINIGSQAYTDLQMKNPELIRKAEMLNSVNTGKGNKKVDGNTVLSNVSENITKDVKKEDIPNYQKMLASNPQVTDAKDKWTEAKTKKDNLQDAIDNVEDEVRAELKGSGATEGYIQALVFDRTKKLSRQYNTAAREESSQLANLQYYSDIVKEDYNTQKETLKDTREFDQQKELATFQQELGLQGKQAEFEQQMAQKAQIANDPVLATQDVLDTYAKLGILPERSNTEIIKSVQNDIAGGMTLGQSLTNLNKAFQSKPQYKEKIAPKLTAASQVWTKLDNTTLYNQATGETKSIKAGTPVTSEEIAGFTTTRNGSTSVQCGELVNDYLKKVTGTDPSGSARFGNTINDKYGALSELGRSDTPQVGGIFVSNPLNNNIGHTGIVSKVNNDGSIEVREANAQGNASGQPPVTKTYSAQQVAQMRFSQAPTIKTQEGAKTQEGVKYSDQQINDLAYLVDLQDKNPSDARKAIKEMGYTDKDISNYRAGNMPLTEKQKTSSIDVMSSIKDLITNYDWNDAVGKFDYSRILGLQGAEDAKIVIDNLVAKLTLPNLGVLKGPMSDKDIEFIKAASSKLGTTQSNSSFEKNIIDAYNLSARRAGMPEIKTLGDLEKTPTITSGIGSSNEIDLFNNIYNQ